MTDQRHTMMLAKAVQWIKANHLQGEAIPITHRNRLPYPEVTGYMIPTLMSVGELELAMQFARWLVTIQRPDGSFSGEFPDRSFVFDTGQVIRGWVTLVDRIPELRVPLQRACEWIVSGADAATGRLQTPLAGSDWSLGARGELSEGVHLYVLKPLIDAADLLHKPAYKVAAERALVYYLKAVALDDFSQPHMLTHFFGYIQEALYELGYRERALAGMASVARFQRANGAVPGYFDVPWVCSTGLAQLAKVWYLLGDPERGDRALDFLAQLQNESGGFYGSYGQGADYFPADEISWAPKYAIDAALSRSAPIAALEAIPQSELPVGKTLEENLNPTEWHESITRGSTPQAVADTVSRGVLPQWVVPMVRETRAGETVLELGSGTGELSAHLASNGRATTLFDFSRECLSFAKQVFDSLGLEAHYVQGDVLQRLPFEDHSIDVIWSSGLLEHFTPEQIGGIVAESARVARKRVVSLVPNANSLAYRIGKDQQERSGRWIWGKETPMATLEPVFRAAGLQQIREYSIAPEHALTFLDAPEFADLRRTLGETIARLSPDLLLQLNQGYLLVTVGDVAPTGPANVVVQAGTSETPRRVRRLVCIPNDPLEDYVAAGYPDLTSYFNPEGFFDEVYCVSPMEKHAYTLYGIQVIPTPLEQFAERVAALGADCIRAYDLPACQIASAQRVAGVPVVCSVHDVNPTRCPGPLPQADVFLSISGAVEQFLLSKGAEKARILSFGNRVDMDVFKPVDDPVRRAAFVQRFPGKYRILLVGRRTEQKNLDTVIRALALLGSEYCGIFVGQGDAQPYLALAEQLQVRERCHFIDAVANHELAAFYSFSDCFCTPSRWEGFGIVFIEALASQAIIVTSDIAPMNEFVKHGESGLLVADYENPDAVAQMVRTAVTDTALGAHIRSRAREAAQPFARTSIERRERAIYEGILGVSRASAEAAP